MKSILIIEDEAALASALAILVRRMGHTAVTVPSAALGLVKLGEKRPDLVVLDIGLPDRSGIDVLAGIRRSDPDLPVLVVTAHGNLENAVEAKKRGASAYLVKPLDLRELEATIQSLLHAPEAQVLPAEPQKEPGHAPMLIGSSLAMQPAFAAIAHACAADVPVLITGPTGIGKSLTARVIHLHSARHAGPFVTLSCASLPESLLEAELFGHERGAFTGAQATRIGHIERAAGGTLFLDEIGDVPPALQVKLLRVVEEKTFVRVGGREDIAVELRIIAATNQDLAEAVEQKRFREDLLYRLRVLEVQLPSLAQRITDLPALCAYLLADICGQRPLSLSERALTVLRRHAWPGNVRELRNVLERAAAVCSGAVILDTHLPPDLRRDADATVEPALLDAALHEWVDLRLRQGCDYSTLHDELEGKLLATLLPRYEGKPTLLARALKVNRATLRKKLRGPDGEPPAP
ncbi:MAG TPA: sigma-54 dependent transcriptional regulator [Planctomycetota bacterium]|nr:sigma-54 dependent transcriptional regulator [Planctomycetota bacterium]